MIATFYSFKGGVGRSMAMANVGEILANWGYRVILCDWDLEAPGLERYLLEQPEELKHARASRGIVDLITEYKTNLSTGSTFQPEPDGTPEDFTSVGADQPLRLRRPSRCCLTVPSPRRSGSAGWMG